MLCFSVNALADMAEISHVFHISPNLNAFEICHGGGCAESNQLSLTDMQWRQVSNVFTKKAQNAEQERAQIAQAIGVLEAIIGEKIGTSADVAGTFNLKSLGQMDCNDEAINTTTYMRLLKQAGFMPSHEIEDTRTRSFFFNGWPHSTAVIHEINSGERFAVDSWFYDNGHAATMLPFTQWKAGYIPADSPILHAQPNQTASHQ
jgi:hypothetical protein